MGTACFVAHFTILNAAHGVADPGVIVDKDTLLAGLAALVGDGLTAISGQTHLVVFVAEEALATGLWLNKLVSWVAALSTELTLGPTTERFGVLCANRADAARCSCTTRLVESSRNGTNGVEADLTQRTVG